MTDTTQPPAETLAEAQEIAIHFALPGMYDGISTHATRRGDADDKPYMRAILAALTRRAGGDAIPAEMTREERRLEDLKQMAAYAGPVVSFDVRDPYYLASCDGCGWVGSSEACGTDEADDVFCPRCHRGGADCGKIAQRVDDTPKPPAGGDAGAVEPSKRAVAYAYLKLRQSEKREMAKALGLPLPDAIGGQLEQDKAFLKSVFDAGRIADLATALALPAPVVEGDLAWLGSDTRLSLEHYSPVYGDDDDQSREWRVHRESGSINDRIWDIVGRGSTPHEAIAAARAALSEGATVADGVTVAEADPETVPGRVMWHTSKEGGGPDVGISVGLGNGSALWIGELLDRDGGPVGIVFHGPGGVRHAARLSELDEVRDLFEHHVAPAIAALSEGRSHG